MRKLSFRTNLRMGCDPEFFLTQDNKICGAERVIKKKFNTIAVDGVQVEINPTPDSCRQLLANNIARCFGKLEEIIEDSKVKVSCDFSRVVKVDKSELNSLSSQARRFGCAPSNNIYTKEESKIKVNPEKYRKRSAGGHIHLSGQSILSQPKRIIPMLDIILGNTCVLIDKDKGNRERRRVYGRAGEYRKTNYGYNCKGLEYRTLSNFWLLSYPLVSFVFGMARVAVNLIDQSTEGHNYEKEILSRVNLTRIEKAINTNDFKLAYSNFKKIEEFLLEISPKTSDDGRVACPINANTISEFHYFISKPLNYWFPDDPMSYWLEFRRKSGYRSYSGWENYCGRVIRKRMRER